MAPNDAAAQGTSGGGGRGGDRLSGLPDRILFRVMSHLRAWEAVQTCVLSKRWRYLWASATRLDVREPPTFGFFPANHGRSSAQRQKQAFAYFLKNLLLLRPLLAPLHLLRLCWIDKAPDGDANIWIAYAVRHGAEEIELSASDHKGYPSPEYMSFIIADGDTVTTHLKILKLTHIQLDGTTFSQLCSRCTCLQELELKDCRVPDATKIRSTKLERLTMVKCRILRGLMVYAPNLASLCCSRSIGYVPWIENLGSLGRVNIMLLEKFVPAEMRSNRHIYSREPDEYPEYSDVVSCNLKILKLSHVNLNDATLRQLCSRCTSLEGLELKDCLLNGKEIGSTSLKYLTMISCKFAIGFRVHAPNLVCLRCIRPFQHFPQIQKMEFLVTAAIVLDDSCLLSDCPWLQKGDESDDDRNDESDRDLSDSKHNESDDSSSYYDSDQSAPSDEDDNDSTIGYSVIAKEERSKVYKYLIHGHKRSGAKPAENYGKYGSKDSVNFGGVGMLCSLSHVKTMDLLAHPEEALLTRELKLCTDLKNLKTLSLGEWCLTPCFNVLAAILGHSPNLESIFLHLDMAYSSRLGFNTCASSSFKCTNLKMVKITCCKHDVMVHRLAKFFRENSIPNKNIFVHYTACSGCRGGTGLQGKRKAQSITENREAKQTKAGN